MENRIRMDSRFKSLAKDCQARYQVMLRDRILTDKQFMPLVETILKIIDNTIALAEENKIEYHPWEMLEFLLDDILQDLVMSCLSSFANTVYVNSIKIATKELDINLGIPAEQLSLLKTVNTLYRTADSIRGSKVNELETSLYASKIIKNSWTNKPKKEK